MDASRATSSIRASSIRDRAFKTIKNASHTVLNLLYPPVCAGCGAATLDPHAFCASCWQGLALIERPFCERLGTPFPLPFKGPLLSPAALADPPVFERARVVTRFDDTARALIHRLKYGDRPELAHTLGGLMRQAGADLLHEADVLVPVPLHRWRLWSRRFNQAMALATVIAGSDEKKALSCDPLLLARVKATRSQVGLTKLQRRDNLQGAFRVPEEAMARLMNKRVLLIDDVMTTGSTANAAARALLKGGAKAVDVLAFARVVVE